MFDHEGTALYREVLADECRSLAAPEAGSFLVGCQDRVYRYGTKP